MAPRYSLVYPTRHRPDFVAEALAFIAQQGTCDEFEVIVCDNYADAALSAQSVCESASLPNVRYVRPNEPLGMVDNWNFAAHCATGEYVCVFTDKIFLLPHALQRISRGIAHAGEPEIVSWVSDAYQSARYPEYFGAGTYTAVQADTGDAAPSARYSPIDALNRKGDSAVSRYEQSPSEYARGKIVFGAYRRSLVSRIVDRFGALFFDISPDYTSMVLALAEARSACELSSSAVVSIATDISNGVLTSTNDALSLTYLRMLSGDHAVMMENMLVPGLYASQANVVSHDYLSLRRRFGLDFHFNVEHWLGYCIEDLSRADRTWSSAEVEQEQSERMLRFLGKLGIAEQSSIVARLERRMAQRAAGALGITPPGQRHSWAAPSLREGVARRAAWS
jgi:glycosyltransferase involved in cell wall biosynthesis